MKIALVYPPIYRNGKYPLLSQNRQFRFSNSEAIRIYPLVFASAATVLSKEGYDVLFKDGINERLSEDDFNKQLFSFNPDIIVIETKAPLVKFHWDYIDKLKQQGNFKIVLLGDHVSFYPKESMENCKVDFVVTGGDYDASLVGLARHLEKGDILPKGVWYRENGEIKNTGHYELIENLNLLPFIDRDLTNWSTYGEAYLYHPCTYILSGRGCGQKNGKGSNCIFCIWQHAFWNCTARLRSPENVAEEIEILTKKYKVKEIFDDNESGPIWDKNWLEKFYSEMKRRKLIGKVFISSNARADSLDNETCRILVATGFRLLKVGIESGSDEILKKLSKGETIERIIEGVKIAKRHGLNVLLTTMVGYPWETQEDVKKTYEVTKELMLYKTHFGDSLQSSIIVPYPGTPLYNYAKQHNLLTDDASDLTKFDMCHNILKTGINTTKWCQKIWKIHLHPMFILKSLFSLKRFEDVKVAFIGVVSLFGHLRDYGEEK